MIARLAILALAALPLGACQHTQQGSVAGGECKVFERPGYAIRGLRPYDQNWIDSQVEGGVAACGWQRPAPRPPELDTAPPPMKKAATPPKKKPGIVKRVKDRVWPAAAAPIAPTPAPPVVVVEPVPLPTPRPRSRDPVDELLEPS